MKKDKFLDDIAKIEPLLKDLPKNWNAKEAITEMKEKNYPHWKQMEWVGFYFQYLCDRRFKGIMKLQQPKYGKTSFDGLMSYPWDFKVHPINTENHEVIVNDREAISIAIDDYGATGLILAAGTIVYNDENRSFQKWHEKIKGGKSKYELARIERGAWSRLRKTSFSLEQILFIKINAKTLKNSRSFQENFRNSEEVQEGQKFSLD